MYIGGTVRGGCASDSGKVHAMWEAPIIGKGCSET